jgi:hypothetical protein
MASIGVLPTQFSGDAWFDKPTALWSGSLPNMAALVRRAVLDALVDPKFQAELPEALRDQIKVKVAEAGQGEYGSITLGYNAKAVREAAQRLRTKRVSKRLAAVLSELIRIPGY